MFIPHIQEFVSINCKKTMKTNTLPDVPKNSKGIWNRFMEGVSIAVIIVIMAALEMGLAYLFNSCGFEPTEYHSWM